LGEKSPILLFHLLHHVKHRRSACQSEQIVVVSHLAIDSFGFQQIDQDETKAPFHPILLMQIPAPQQRQGLQQYLQVCKVEQHYFATGNHTDLRLGHLESEPGGHEEVGCFFAYRFIMLIVCTQGRPEGSARRLRRETSRAERPGCRGGWGLASE